MKNDNDPINQANTNTQTSPSNHLTNDSRRKSLKTLALGTTAFGGAMAVNKWSEPIINSVITPAHAQASPLSCEGVTPPSGTQTFNTPGEFQFIVPDCVTEVTIEVNGAGGGSFFALDGSLFAAGGMGGFSSGTLTVTSGEVLSVFVGGQGTDMTVASFASAPGGFGFGSGGTGAIATTGAIAPDFGGAGGGGGSAVLQNNVPAIVAGGGGGSIAVLEGGDGGGVQGEIADNSTLLLGGIGSGSGGGLNGDGADGTNDGSFGNGAGNGGDGLAGPGGTTVTGGGNSGDGSVIISW